MEVSGVKRLKELEAVEIHTEDDWRFTELLYKIKQIY